MRGYLLLLVLAVTTIGLTACAQLGEDDDVICPAVGYFNTAHLMLSEPRPGLNLELRAEYTTEPEPTNAPMEYFTTGDPSLEAMNETGVDDLTGNSVSGWTAVTNTSAPPTFGYRITDASRATVAEGSVEVAWVQIGGTTECGGPKEADITLPG